MAFVGAFVSMYVDLVLRPHPGFEQSGGIVTIGKRDAERMTCVPLELIERMNEEAASIETVAGVNLIGTQVVGADGDQTVVELVTEQFFSGLLPKIELGRGFEPADHDPDAAPVAVLTDQYWRDAYGGDPDVIGTTFEIVLQVSG